MVAEIICVGTEILLGNIVNTNAAFLSERLAGLGVSVFFETTVGDNPERLEEVIKQGLNRSDVLILSGGLGPTKDDLTKEIAAKACGQSLIQNDEAMMHLKEYFKGRESKMTENNIKQAYVPEECMVFQNTNGTAPGMMIYAPEGKKVILLPGPPNELIPMFRRQVEPVLESLHAGILYSKVIKIDSLGESLVETKVSDLIAKQSNPTVATYAKTGEVHIRVTAKAETREIAQDLIQPVLAELHRRFPKEIFTEEEDVTLEEVVVRELATKNYSISTAESCTGGLLSGRLINVAGASDVLNEGFITYSNEAKMKHLGVKKETLDTYGAVSKETAKEMAEGVAKAAGANVGVGITGLAGPGGETETKKVGLVYIGVCVNGITTVKKYQFKGNRRKVRESAVSKALTQIRKCIK